MAQLIAIYSYVEDFFLKYLLLLIMYSGCWPDCKRHADSRMSAIANLTGFVYPITEGGHNTYATYCLLPSPFSSGSSLVM
jgi:hypothetical protein